MFGQEGWMDDVKTLNLLVQSGSFGVLVLLVIWVIRFIPKRIEKADHLRELEAEAKKEVATTLHKIVTEQEKAQSERVDKLIASHNKAVDDLNRSHMEGVDKILASHAEQLRYEREICGKYHAECQEDLQAIRKEGTEDRQKQYDLLRELTHAMKDIQQTRANERALSKIRQSDKKPPSE